MADIPERELEETRAALAPTLEATAAILPWVAAPRKARFDPKLNERWIAAGKRLAAAWSERHGAGADDVRPAIFSLYAIAIETADANCLRLGEALASAADRLEEGAPPRLIAAMAAAIECLSEAEGLEHPAFPERASHFAKRLEAAAATANPDERSVVLDALFVDEASEQIQLMHDALAALPPDAYALATESLKLAQQAELLEIWGVMHLARQLSECIKQHAADLDNATVRQEVQNRLETLSSTIATVNR
ncbi:MAG: hypothetical protein CVU33_09155 [Betaproteobacteria bacterium HGW-Betaproteobacteria-6]|jgi:hypothetical protein|nr:MAG: hypothetical protein CVU33_09155 [Betaproteobacteria bacterium HGW-Betaproteobacteria-6]